MTTQKDLDDIIERAHRAEELLDGIIIPRDIPSDKAEDLWAMKSNAWDAAYSFTRELQRVKVEREDPCTSQQTTGRT